MMYVFNLSVRELAALNLLVFSILACSSRCFVLNRNGEFINFFYICLFFFWLSQKFHINETTMYDFNEYNSKEIIY